MPQVLKVVKYIRIVSVLMQDTLLAEPRPQWSACCSAELGTGHGSMSWAPEGPDAEQTQAN